MKKQQIQQGYLFLKKHMQSYDDAAEMKFITARKFFTHSSVYLSVSGS